MSRIGRQTAYVQMLGLNDYIYFSFERHSPIPDDTIFKIPTIAALKRPGTLVFSYDAPFFHVGLSLEEHVARGQAIALRGTDYLQLLPAYMSIERRGGKASEHHPQWLQEKLYLPKSYQSAEVKTFSNLALDSVHWRLQIYSALPKHKVLIGTVDPAIVAARFIDKSRR